MRETEKVSLKDMEAFLKKHKPHNFGLVLAACRSSSLRYFWPKALSVREEGRNLVVLGLMSIEEEI